MARGAATTCLVVGTGSIYLVGALVAATGISRSLLLQVIVGAGVVPVLTTIAMHHIAPFVHKPRPAVTAPGFPHRAPLTFVVLVGFTVIQLLAHLPAPALLPPPRVAGDWAQRSGLGGPAGFGFIGRFLGPHTTLARFTVPDVEGMPHAAVDVITTPNLAALRDYFDAVWYPASTPVNFTVARPKGDDALQVRAVHSNADAATTSDHGQWYALTWEWQVPSGFQQVTVIVSQDDVSRPPDPRPLSVSNTFAGPVLWIARQQPNAEGGVPKDVVDRAERLAGQMLALATPNNA